MTVRGNGVTWLCLADFTRKPCLADSQATILHFSFWLGPGLSHEMALDLVYGANFRCVLHHFLDLARSHGSGGQFVAPNRPNTAKHKKRKCFFPQEA
jgi:hypothetical protein